MAVFGSYENTNKDRGKEVFLRLLYHTNTSGRLISLIKDPDTGEVESFSTDEASKIISFAR